eukprot:SAG11_NODE_340_length_10476_cov_6.009155_13_plen_59_part_00
MASTGTEGLGTKLLGSSRTFYPLKVVELRTSKSHAMQQKQRLAEAAQQIEGLSGQVRL